MAKTKDYAVLCAACEAEDAPGCVEPCDSCVATRDSNGYVSGSNFTPKPPLVETGRLNPLLLPIGHPDGDRERLRRLEGLAGEAVSINEAMFDTLPSVSEDGIVMMQGVLDQMQELVHPSPQTKKVETVGDKVADYVNRIILAGERLRKRLEDLQ